MILPRVVAAFCLCAVVLVGCTAGGKTGDTSSTTTSGAATSSSAPPAPPVVAPIVDGKITEHPAASCPLLNEDFVHLAVGMRLARVTVLRDRAGTVGCRFYALTHPNAQCNANCLRLEDLPGPNQPAVEIVTSKYPTPLAAHNAFVRIADKGTDPQQHQLTATVTAVCFRTEFDPSDKGQDWACGFSKTTTLVLVRVAQTSPALDALEVTQKALGAV